MTILFVVIDGEITGGNMVCLAALDGLLSRGGRCLLVTPRDGPFCDLVRERGVPVVEVDTTRSFRWRSARTIAAVARREKVDIIHAHAPFAGSVLARLAGLLARIPVVTHAHVRDTFNTNRAIRGYQWLANWCTSRFPRNTVVAVSEAVRRDFVQAGVSQSRTRVIYNGVNVHPPAAPGGTGLREELGIDVGTPIIAHIGRLCPSKGQHLTVAALAELSERFPEPHLLIVGEDLASGGTHRSELEALAQGLGVSPRVHFLGRRSDVRSLLSESMLLVLPSTIEGLPLVVLEAMAAARPVVASAVDGNVEVVTDGETGRLVDPLNVTTLASAIAAHLSDPAESAEMGRRGWQVARERFSHDRMVEQTLQLYHAVQRESARG